MAIVIQSLTPTNPTTPAGGSVTFSVTASDDLGAPLSYEWQFSQNGTNYTASGLTNNTSATFDTGALTINQSGLYFRVVISNGNPADTVNSNDVPSIGDRIVVVYQDPSIIINVDNTVDSLPTSQTKDVGEDLVLVVSASLLNADVSSTALVSNISFQWQYSEDSGSTWINLSAGGNVLITDTVDLINGTSSYMKYSTLVIQNLDYDDNLTQYRVRVSYTGAINTPVDSSSSLLYVDPVINVYRQPGVDANDTSVTNCYKTSISGSGNVRVSVGALTTAGTSLTFQWQVDVGDGVWNDIGDVLGSYIFALKPGTTENSDLLELERFIYYDRPGFRCIISGSVGEASVTTNAHYIYMTDVQTPVELLETSYDINEDKYGDIANRSIYVNDPIQSLALNATIDISRNTGQNGNDTFTWQRQDPGSSTWVDVGDIQEYYTETIVVNYTQFPSSTPDNVAELFYTTPPLRVDTDNGAKYRVKVESSSVFTLNGNVKTITPFYSDEITVNVYRTIYITNQPSDVNVYANASAAFSVSATPSSGSTSDITYQWQYNVNNTTSGWLNIANSSPYSGATTDLLTINPVPSPLTYRYYRCILSVPGQLSSVTTNVALITLERDYFTAISSLNDVVVNEYSNHTFTITASTISAQAITYQWEKSFDYVVQTNTGTWSDITGETTNTLTLLSVGDIDDAYYRVKLTSFGGTILYSNIARLTVQDVSISLLEDITSSISILEGQVAAHTFTCEGLSSIGTAVSYQWQIRRVGDSSFSNIGAGYNNTTDNTDTYILRALDTIADSGAVIRCKISAVDVPNDIYTTECTVTVVRRFTYYADVATKRVTIGNTLTLDLNPTFTGGSPSYSWEENGVAMNETTDTLVIPNITSAYNGRVYRCNITLDACTEHRYSRSNVDNIVAVTPPSAYTVSITLNTVTAPSEPVYYSNETAKTGAAIGTVICIPKPDGYVEDTSATDDDISRWKCAQSGTAGNTTAVSTETSGSIFNSNKPSWATSYSSPKWLLNEDRFKGYIELRGQYVKALDFPELARQWGTKFGGTITGTYPNYNSNDIFRLPNTYAKRLVGTGNVDNNSGSISVVPLYDAAGASGGDKNIPGSMGGQYNYERSAQLPPDSPGVSGEPDGTAGVTTAATFNIGSYTTTGMDQVTAFVQPSFAGTVTYNVGNPGNAFTDLPSHTHQAVSAGYRETTLISSNQCWVYGALNPGGEFRGTDPAGGSLDDSTTTLGESHAHVTDDIGPGNFNMVTDAGMGISDSTLRFTGANTSIMNNNLEFFLRNNEQIPLNAPYFRLKYMIKAY